jgi:hypothetical protein
LATPAAIAGMMTSPQFLESPDTAKFQEAEDGSIEGLCCEAADCPNKPAGSAKRTPNAVKTTRYQAGRFIKGPPKDDPA